MRKRRRDFLEALVAGGICSAAVSRVVAEPAQKGTPVNSRLFTFAGGMKGAWSVVKVRAVIGVTLPVVARLDIVNSPLPLSSEGVKWILRGVTSNERYVTRDEKAVLAAKQASLGRTEATHSALIPIRKSAKWWSMTQDERRAVFEEQSHHLKNSLKFLPAIARRLHHCRDLGESEPFDFVTLFDYAKADSDAFEELVAVLRASEEWKFVEREVDIRMVREPL